jgi:hypothetical protein
VSIAWKIILIADLGVSLYGLLLALNPDDFLANGFQSVTGESWSALHSDSPETVEYISLLGRTLGGFNVAFGALAIFIVLKGFRKGEVWS